MKKEFASTNRYNNIVSKKRNLKDFLIEKFGYSESVADEITDKTGIRDTKLIEQKIEEFKLFSGLLYQEIGKIIKLNPIFMNCSTNLIQSFYDFLNNRYGFSISTINEMIVKNPSIVSCTQTRILELEQWFSEKYSFSIDMFAKKIKTMPRLCGTTPAYIEELEQFLFAEYKLNIDNFIALIKTCGSFPLVSKENIKDKEEFFKKEFNIKKEEFAFMLRSGKPVQYSKENILATYNYLNGHLGILKEEFASLIIKAPSILGFDPASTETKIKKVYELGIDKDILFENPKILTLNAQQTKIRYMLAMISGVTSLSNFLSRDFMCNEQKIFARIQGIKKVGRSMSNLYLSEAKFNKYTGLHSEDLMQTYPLTKDIMLQIQEEFLKIFPSANIKLDDEELSYAR